MNPNYIIDFERINQLTSHANDMPSAGYTPTYSYSHTRKLLKEYLELYSSIKITDERYQHIVDTLVYNKILLRREDIRDGKINELIKF